VGELRAFHEGLAAKPVIVVATKLDATTDRNRLEQLREYCAAHGLEFHAISAATGEGVRELVRAIADALDKLPRPAPESALDTGAASPENAREASTRQADCPPRRRTAPPQDLIPAALRCLVVRSTRFTAGTWRSRARRTADSISTRSTSFPRAARRTS